MTLPRSLCSIIPMLPSGIQEAEIYLPLFDYCWPKGSTPPRQGKSEMRLAKSSSVLAQDLVNAAVYSLQILGLRDRSLGSTDLGPAVVVAGTLAEAFFVSVRCAWDALAMGLAVAACGKAGQVPDDSMRALLNWANKNQKRVHPRLLPILESDAGWFWRLRTFRDYLLHQGSDAFIFWDGTEFRFSLFPRFDGSPFQEPLLPLMASISEHFLAFAHGASEAVQEILPLPPERRHSMVLHSPFIPYLRFLRRHWSNPPGDEDRSTQKGPASS